MEKLLFNNNQAVKNSGRNSELIQTISRRFFGSSLGRPCNLPANWEIEVVHGGKDIMQATAEEISHYGLKYTHPENTGEYVKAMPGNKANADKILHSPYVAYHFPSKNVNKDLQSMRLFDRTDPECQQFLDQISKSPLSIGEKAVEARKALGNFYFSIEDLNHVRHCLGMDLIPSQVIEHIRKIICECHYLVVSEKQLGMMFKHREKVQFAKRVAWHAESSTPFMKINTDRGYHTLTGAITGKNTNEAHISLDEVLQSQFDWYAPPCTSVYALEKFDYAAANAKILKQIGETDKSSATLVWAAYPKKFF